MNFSELFRQSNQICQFSPDGKYLASVVEFKLVIRDVDTFQIQNLFSCQDTIQEIEWSADSQFILCGLYKRGIVQVWSLEQPEWKCKIDEGSAGLCAVRWSPDSRNVLTTADFHLRITVWSLVTKSVSYIRYPKQCKKNMAFSPNGRRQLSRRKCYQARGYETFEVESENVLKPLIENIIRVSNRLDLDEARSYLAPHLDPNCLQSYMALAERRDCQDFISIFTCNSWELLKHFESSTDDLSGLQWSPDSGVICVWDAPLNYLLLLYSIDGRCLAKYSAYDGALGIKCLSWSPTSQFVAVGSYDEKLRLLNHITWKTITTFHHPETLDSDSVIVYKEVENRVPQAAKSKLTDIPTLALFTAKSKYEVQSCPVKIPIVKPDTNKPNPKRGIGLAAFSEDCKYIFTRNDNMPHTLWIWDVQKLAVCALLVQTSPIKYAEWDRGQNRLAVCTGTNKLYMWSPAGALCVEIPVEGTFQVHSLKWHPQGGSLLLLGKEMMCICYLNDCGAETD